MLEIFWERFRQKKRTVAFPKALPVLSPRFRGRPFIDGELCAGVSGKGCGRCAAVCPLGAVTLEEGAPALDMGLCIFCGACARACPQQALEFTTDWRLASTRREALIIRPCAYKTPPHGRGAQGTGAFGATRDGRLYALPELPIAALRGEKRLFASSFRLRQVTAAGCGACEADLNVLSTIVFDIGRFGMDFVASPRHADALVLTGPVPENMRRALRECHVAMPAPKVVIAAGACAISGGLFKDNAPGAEPHVSVDLFLPGCPPHPYTSLDGLLRFLGLQTPSFF